MCEMMPDNLICVSLKFENRRPVFSAKHIYLAYGRFQFHFFEQQNSSKRCFRTRNETKKKEKTERISFSFSSVYCMSTIIQLNRTSVCLPYAANTIISFEKDYTKLMCTFFLSCSIVVIIGIIFIISVLTHFMTMNER